MHLEDVRDYARLEAIRDPWSDLVARLDDASPYSSPEFLLPWLGLVRDVYRCRVLVAWEGARLIGLAPLFERSVGRPPLRLVLRSFPLHGTTPPFDLLVDEPRDAVLREFLESWRRAADWDLLELPSIPTTSATLGLLRDRAGGSRLLLDARPGRRALSVTIRGSWAEFVRARSPKFRYRYDLRRCERFGAVTFDRFPGGRLTLDEALAAANAIVVRSWKRDDAGRRRWEGFLAELAHGLHAAGRLSLHLLCMDSRPVAYVLELDHRGNRHAFHIAYDLEFQKAGPGIVLLAQAIRDAHDEGLARYELGGYEAYLRRWTDDVIEYVDVTVRRAAVLSRVKVGLYLRTREGRKAAARRRTEEKKNVRKALGGTPTEAEP